MQPIVHEATISADGTLEAGSCIDKLKAGDTLKLTLNGNKIIGGKNRQTLLGNQKKFLPASICLQLNHVEPASDGTSLLTYSVADYPAA